MKIGIVSFAHMHSYSYANAIGELDNVQLSGIYDPDKERGETAAEQYQVQYFASYEELLKQDIDAVIITSENIDHRKYVIEAANAKKHVLCEKPLATTVEDGQAMIDACNQNNVMLQVAFPVRFNTTMQRAKQIIEDQKLGTIIAMKGTNRGQNPGGWFIDKSKSGGGAVIDHTVHVVDIMRWLLKCEIEEVYAEVDHLFSEEVIDDAGVLTMGFENGVFATLDCSWSRNKSFPTWGDVTLEIVGTEGTLSIDALGQNIHVYSDDIGVRRDFWGDDMDKELIRDFVENVVENKTPSVTGIDGLRALEVALGAYQSAETKLPVQIR